MDNPTIRGVVTRQAHVGIPEGTYEEEIGREGFFGRYAHLYRSRPPVEWTRFEGELRPRAYDVFSERQEPSRVPLLSNADVSLSVASLSSAPTYWFRNADADELLFVHLGRGEIETDFGRLSYRPGDYLQIPRGTLQRPVPSEPTRWLVVESASELRFPEKGMLGQHALFDPAMIEVPEPDTERARALKPDGREYEVRVQRLGKTSRVYYPTPPITTVGWKGTLSALKINVEDIRPVLSDRYHLPPSAHTTFVARGFVVCTFLPRPLENGDPKALKVPFFHSNVDYDEVIFYHSGEFFSRVGIGPGMMTFHPQGIPHGPQPGAAERSKAATRTQEVAVMIDARNPLEPAAGARALEREEYWKSWGAK